MGDLAVDYSKTAEETSIALLQNGYLLTDSQTRSRDLGPTLRVFELDSPSLTARLVDTSSIDVPVELNLLGAVKSISVYGKVKYLRIHNSLWNKSDMIEPLLIDFRRTYKADLIKWPLHISVSTRDKQFIQHVRKGDILCRR